MWTLTALQETYRAVDEALFKKGKPESRDGFKFPLKTGSTCTTAIVTDTHIIVAHIGDSQAMLVRDSKMHYLTRTHTADEHDEKQRIHAASAVIKEVGAERHVYDPVVGRSLGMTRSFGDFHLKADQKLSKEAQAVICEPEIKVFERTAQDESLFIASDGLWDAKRAETLRRSSVKVSDEYKYADQRTGQYVYSLALKAHMDGSTDNISVIWLRLCKGRSNS